MTGPDLAAAWMVLICTVVIFTLLAVLFARAHRNGQRVRATVLGLTLLHEFVLILFPGWYSFGSGFSLEAGVGVSPDQLARVYTGEALFIVLFTLGYLIPSRKVSVQGPGRRWEAERMFLMIVLIGGIGMYVGRLFDPTFTAKALEKHWEITVRAGLRENLQNWVNTLFQWPGLITAAIVVAGGPISRLWRIAAWTILGAQLIYAMMYGLRGGIVYVVSIIGAAGYYCGRKKALIICGLLTVALVPLFPWLHSNMRYISFAVPEGTSRIEMIPMVLNNIVDATITREEAVRNEDFITAWAVRAEGPRNSVTMYSLYESDQSAGYRPILGALVLPVPRVLWPEKPVAGSTDSTNLGAAIYRVQQVKTAFSDMGPVLASAHAYWEGGWVGLIVAGLLSGWMWRTLFLWSEQSDQKAVDIMVLTMLTALPVDGFFSAINPVFSYLRVIWITIIPLTLLTVILHRLMYTQVMVRSLRLNPRRRERHAVRA